MFTFKIFARPKRPEALCPTCVFAVTHSGFSGEELTCCSLGGGIRELPFAVCECTAYTDSRIRKPDRVVGFVKTAPEATVIKIA